MQPGTDFDDAVLGLALPAGVRRRALQVPDEEAEPLPYVQASGAAARAQLA